MRNFWIGKNVLLTGHTGFKGSWLAEILFKLGANVTGCALNAKRRDALFYLCKLENKIEHHIIDIRDGAQLSDLVTRSMPDIVFHLAAQPLVLSSYTEPVKTWETNVFGSINLLESLKTINKKCAVIMVTTDKVYELDQTNMPKKKMITLVAMTHTAPVKQQWKLPSQAGEDLFRSIRCKVGNSTCRKCDRRW